MKLSPSTQSVLDSSEQSLLGALGETEKARAGWGERADGLAQSALNIQGKTTDPLEHHRAEQAFQRARRAGAILESI